MSSSDLSVMTNEILTVLVAKAIEETLLRLIYDETYILQQYIIRFHQYKCSLEKRDIMRMKPNFQVLGLKADNTLNYPKPRLNYFKIVKHKIPTYKHIQKVKQDQSMN